MSNEINLDVLSSQLDDLAIAFHKPFVVSIDGRSGVGKSTLAEKLSKRLKANVLQGDDFFKGGVELSKDDAETLANRCIDRKAQIDVLTRLCANQSASYTPFDWKAFDGSLSSRKLVIEPSPIILFEGVYSCHPELVALVNHRILLTVSEDERSRRLLRREGSISSWERQWHRAEDWYFSRVVSERWFDQVFE